MPLSYPEGFPEPFRVPVVAVNVIAENKLRGLIDKNPDRHAVRTAAVEYIATVACAFGIQACRAAQAGEWPISSIEKVTETEFLRRLLVHTRFEFLGKYYREWEHLADDVIDRVKKREEWAQYKKALIEVASGAGTAKKHYPDTFKVSEEELDIEPGALRGVSVALAEAPVYVFRRTSDGRWDVQFDGQRSLLKHVKGLELIRRLLARPNVPLSALMLLDRVDQEGISVDDGVPAMDGRARGEYEKRIKELEEKIENARLVGNSSVESELREEQLAIHEYLDQATGSRGRIRRIGSEIEKARLAATRRCRTALRVIGGKIPSLEQHLQETIRSGREFIYSPECDFDWRT